MFKYVINIFRFLIMFLVVSLLITSCTAKKESGKVYVVYCIDTESDAYNYRKFQQSLKLNSLLLGTKATFDTAWRNRLKDSYGNRLKISWFLMTIEGYRHTFQGINAIPNMFIKNFKNQINNYQDEIGWHYHHSDWYKQKSKNYFQWNLIETFNNTIYRNKTDREIAIQQFASFVYLNRFYPAVFRAGWVWENRDFSNWLDSLIPFDYSHNWSEVDNDLNFYHPNKNNLFESGKLSRTIIKSVEKDTTYIESLFKKASHGETVLYSYYTHNYGITKNNNCIISAANRTHSKLKKLSQKYGVKFRYCSASEAAQLMLNIKDSSQYTLNVNFNKSDKSICVSNSNNTFGVPLICYKTTENEIKGAFLSQSKNGWYYVINNSSIISFIIASVNKNGNAFVSKDYIIRQ